MIKHIWRGKEKLYAGKRFTILALALVTAPSLMKAKKKA
jgi:hypothetical protein